MQSIGPRDRKVRVLATLGPASSGVDNIRTLFLAGADAFRINMSHGEHAIHAANIAAIRSLEAELGRPTTILADLQGPKLRVGKFASPPVMLVEGQHFTLDSDPTPGDATRVQLPHPEILSALVEGARLLVDDGKLVLRVTAAHGDRVETVVVVGGAISDRKGVNMPDVVVPLAGADREGPPRSGVRAGAASRLDRAEFRAAARGCRRSAHADQGRRRRAGEV